MSEKALEDPKKMIADAMYFISYREFPDSLHAADLNYLVGQQLYREDRPVYEPCAWRGPNWNERQAELLRLALLMDKDHRLLGATELANDDEVLGPIIQLARSRARI